MVAAESQSFHPGECKIQERLGVREQVEALGRRMIRDHMPDQHRIFYSKLPILLVGSIDEAGRPWASALFGRPGFVSSPDPRTLTIGARPVFGDPLNQNLAPEAEIGLLGIEFPSRRRNRINATVSSLKEGEIGVRVKQAFGNCPQYIQTRDLKLLPAIDRVGVALPVSRLYGFGEPERRIIGRADSFFIASYFSKGSGNATHGVDVSHRGGKPGFVRIDDHHTLTFPDFSGNLLFNTLGNILLNPRTGLLFIDFENNDLLYLTGTAVIIWDSEEKRAFTGAERLIRFTLEEGIRIQEVVPIQWRFLEYSPSLEQTGCWDEVAATLAARHQGLKLLNISDDRIHYEFFVKGQSLHCELQRGFDSANRRGSGTVPVTFKRSAISTIWDPSKGTLLDLAESKGLNPAYSCRSGICQTCTTKLVTGKVEYLERPMAVPKDGEALICCCYPSAEKNGVDADQSVVLDI